MKTLREYIKEADEQGYALGHFNIANTEMLSGIVGAAQAHETPVIIGTSEGERDFIGLGQAVALVRSLREEGLPVFLNADHTYSPELAKKAIDAGYDAVIIDASDHSFEDNISKTREVVEYAREQEALRQAQVDKNTCILVEGELGYIGKGSSLLSEIPDGAAVDEAGFTKPERAKEFVEKTGIDLLAPAVGNLHGMLKDAKNPSLDIARIKQVRKAGGVPLVLHGGSGVSESDFREAITAGISTVHVSTELRLAYRKALTLSLQENPNELAPYRYGKSAVQSVEDVVRKKINLFTNP